MLQLVERLRQKEYASSIRGVRSHDALVIGNWDFISVECSPRERVFYVEFLEQPAGKVLKRQCGYLEGLLEAERLIDAFALRLSFARTHRETVTNSGEAKCPGG